MKESYMDFLKSKMVVAPKSGIPINREEISDVLKPHQRDAVYWAVVGEEYGEIMEAIMAYRRVQTVDTLKKVLWESTDTITAIVSLLDKLGFDADDTATMQMMINESNAKRDGGRRFA